MKKNKIDSHYQQSLQALTDWIRQNELERRKWAGEKWAHPYGRWFLVARIGIPILTIFGLMCVLIYCYIRNAQVYLSLLGAHANGNSTAAKLAYEADIEFVELYTVILAVCGLLMIIGCVLLAFLKKYKIGVYFILFPAAVTLVHVATQFQIAMPDNSNTDYAPLLGYTGLCVILVSVFAIVLLLCLAVLFIFAKDKHNIKKMVNHTLQKITADNALATDEEYCEMIEQYIRDEKLKKKQRNDKKSRKAAAIMHDDAE